MELNLVCPFSKTLHIGMIPLSLAYSSATSLVLLVLKVRVLNVKGSLEKKLKTIVPYSKETYTTGKAKYKQLITQLFTYHFGQGCKESTKPVAII